MRARVNCIKRCLRCKGEVKPIEELGVPKSWGFGRWAMTFEGGVWCAECGIIYWDFGRKWNRVRMYRILAPVVCRDCGLETCVGEGEEDNSIWCKCIVCGKGHWKDEPSCLGEITHGYARGVLNGKFVWIDGNQKFMRFEYE